jgi:alginate O-acetyltransferase complex protein AlgI
MVFSSLIFLYLFLPVSLLVYYLLSGRLRNLWIVLISLFFYSWGAPKYVFVVIAAMLMDFIFARLIHEAEGRKKKLLLFAGVAINVGALLYFKYFNFFIDNLNHVIGFLGGDLLKFAKVTLPIGISFFTFHEISYLVDVYRAKKLPFKRLTDYSLYILFFPQLIAGPIIRFSEISDQIADYKRRVSSAFILTGFQRFVIGLSKKVLVANVCGAQADLVFGMEPAALSTTTAWIGVLAYTMQIYFDFSGYSDMAIGLARMMGFVFPENFNVPYIAQNITDFWRRWHMSLSRWIKDYLYISLGGNRGGSARTYFNLIVCFLISGFWHGAEWTLGCLSWTVPGT